ncbi:MAG: zinc-ribbon domain-containing protein, partial [Lachnospiraceae bacterium]|nr:zinc-ribbon domain-containing protein [Lachnospiraceae bacterium]
LSLWKRLDLITKNIFLWEMILVNVIANICLFASFMYPQISRLDLTNIITGLNCSYEELDIIVCIYNSVSNYFSLPLLQYSDAKIITINLLQNIVAFFSNTFLFAKIIQILFGDDYKFVNEKEMTLALCPECGEKISTKAIVCPNCGYPIKEVKTNVKKEKEDAKTEIDDI